MTLSGMIDTTVLVHLYRGSTSAAAWLRTQSELGVSSVTQLEFIYGARGKNGLLTATKLLNAFTLVCLTDADQMWAIDRMKRLRLSLGIEINDTLIASACNRLQIPIFTHNVKDMRKLLPTSLVIEPYATGEGI
jgi:predicted nucleic acid-binding protein